jgi:hypothetical protein
LLINQIHILINKKIQELGLEDLKDSSIENKISLLSNFVVDSLKKHVFIILFRKQRV